LAKRGHQVAFCNPAAAPSRLIAEAGFNNLIPNHPLYYLMQLNTHGEMSLGGLYREIRSGRLMERFGGLWPFVQQALRGMPTRFSIPGSEVWSVDHLAACSFMLNEGYVRLECQALVRLMQENLVDVVVDSLAPIACLAARIAHKPLVTLLQADMHPDSRGFIWWKDLPPNLPTPVPVLNKILAGQGLPPIHKTEDLLAGDLTLVLGMPETDPLPLTAKVTYVGAILWQKAGARLPDGFETLDPDRPVIWIYSGNPRYLPIPSPVDSAVVIQACAAALADEPVQVVLSTGHHAVPKGMLPLPANFRHVPYVPGLLMAERSDLMIHHGGYGSCQTGLYTGTPAVIIPTYSERESNARRVALAGAGEYILAEKYGWSGKRVPVDELRARVQQVLSNPAYRANARRVSEKLHAYGGALEAARLIEEYNFHQGLSARYFQRERTGHERLHG
jgi:hypothetical protein